MRGFCPTETKQQIVPIPSDRTGIDAQTTAALTLRDRDSGVPLLGLHTGVELSRLTIDDQAARYAALLGQSFKPHGGRSANHSQAADHRY